MYDAYFFIRFDLGRSDLKYNALNLLYLSFITCLFSLFRCREP